MSRLQWIGSIGLGVVLVLSLVVWRLAVNDVQAAADDLRRLRDEVQRVAVTSGAGTVNPAGVTNQVRAALAEARIPESSYVSVLPSEGRSGGADAGALVDLQGLRLPDLGRWLAAMRVGAADAWLIQDIQLTAGLDSGSYVVTVQLVAPGGR